MRRDPCDSPAAAFVFLILLGLIVSTISRLAVYLVQ